MRFETPYWLLVGSVMAAVGGLSILLGLTGGDFHLGPMAITGAYSLWRGAVLFAAGGFLLKAASGRLEDREDEALVFMGSVMIWIVGGTEVLSILLGAIPGGPGVWVADLQPFLHAVGPPYPPSVVAIVVTLPALRYAEEDVRTMVRRIFGRDEA